MCSSNNCITLQSDNTFLNHMKLHVLERLVDKRQKQQSQLFNEVKPSYCEFNYDKEQKDKANNDEVLKQNVVHDLKNEQIYKATVQFRCLCNVCQQEKRICKIGDLSIEKFFTSDNVSKKNQLNFIVQKMIEIYNNDSQAFLRMDILDTVVFSSGEIVNYIYSDKVTLSYLAQEKMVKNFKGKEKLKQLFVKNHFLEKRKKQEQDLIKERQMHVKHIKNGQEIALVKYVDDSYQLFGENQFTVLMLNRITDKLWQDISYIQLIPKKMNSNFEIITVRFMYEEQKDCQLFKKSLDEINMNCQLINQKENAMKRQLQDQMKFEEELKCEGLYLYAKFQVFKLINFIEAYTGIRINTMQVDFFVDEYSNVCLMGLNYLQCFNVDSMANKTNYLKKVRVYDKQKQEQLFRELEEHKKITDMKRINHQIDFMNEFYENIKDDLEIDLNAKTPEDFTSQIAFEQINPNNKNANIMDYIQVQKDRFQNNSSEYRMYQKMINQQSFKSNKHKSVQTVENQKHDFAKSDNKYQIKINQSTMKGFDRFVKNQFNVNHQIPVRQQSAKRFNMKSIEQKKADRFRQFSARDSLFNSQKKVVTQIKHFNTNNLENSLPFLLAHYE